MFCFQCEQTKRGRGVAACVLPPTTCGKEPSTAGLQDLLLHAVQGIAQYTTRSRALGVADDEEVSAFIALAVFSTLTNVNFSDERIVELIRQAADLRDRARDTYRKAARAAGLAPDTPGGPASWQPAADLDGLLLQAGVAALDADTTAGPDVIGLRALNLYGIKGICAYAYHAHALGHDDPEVYAGVESALAYLAGGPNDLEQLLGRSLELGLVNLAVLKLLDAANTGRFGTPVPTPVRTSPVAGPAILVSGHDLGDLETVLEQTAGLGINVYTHGELLPAHGYPKLAAHPHLVGNYGGAWQEQAAEFAAFPGAILMTSNCLIEPRDSYADRIFTLGPVAWPGVRHLDVHDISAAIEAARAAGGFAGTGLQQDQEPSSVLVGFGADAVLAVAGPVVEAVRSGAVRHFFLVGGCDGAKAGRNYYTRFAQSAPDDTVLLTLGCGKFRFNHLDFGDIGGIPRLLDVGQCNDSYSAIRIATALAEALDCGVNDLPLTLVISWFEQKAVAVLLTLLALGLRNITLGPSLPAFLTPALLEILVDRFGISPIGEVEADLERALARVPAAAG
ncbi:MAG TPA: hydroxylamine reductase [Kineosporiaceae bacterium]|nr:hydroxylamine reductase [Kineosporiaceae bacterium]